MRMHIAIVCAVALFAAACAAPPPRIQQRQDKVDLSPYQALWVVVDARKEVAAAHGLDVTSAELRRQFVEQLRDRIALPVLEVAPAAGKSALGVELEIRDKDKEAALWRLTAAHTERHGQNPFSATTGSQISDIAREFAERLAAAARP
jgi:hypothetical protein